MLLNFRTPFHNLICTLAFVRGRQMKATIGLEKLVGNGGPRQSGTTFSDHFFQSIGGPIMRSIVCGNISAVKSALVSGSWMGGALV